MHSIIERIARLSALVGGLVLTFLIVLVCVSVLGRGLNTFGHADFLSSLSEGAANWLIGTGVGPVNGDFELVEAGIAFAIFAFFPICQFHGAHATVDIFTSAMPSRIRRALVALWEVLLALVIILIAWRLFAGMEDKRNYGETTLLLQFPVWWAYAASVCAAAVASVVAVYCALARIGEAVTDRAIFEISEGADH